MSYKYYHDSHKKTVYMIASEPDVTPLAKGGWIVTADLHITAANNYKISNSQWASPVFRPLSDRYYSMDTEQEVKRFFIMNHYPTYPSITKKQYLELQAAYENQARENQDPRLSR